ncbi:MAG TPA: NAD-dependent epimerase/dehydratase family protein [Gemmatimonadaceae bacterium]|nr:NAD-dependent epimerase/dehydratase family protein [Gemmatimonadaceae bacterium]
MSQPLSNIAPGAVAPAPTSSESALEEWLSRPGDELPAALARLGGDVVVLGAGGKMGPSLARMARRALDAAGGDAARRRVYAVSRFAGEQGAGIQRMLDEAGVHTLRADLADRAQVAALPDAGNVVFMAGQKFGTRDDPALTWVMNSYVPALCAERYEGARAVVFSTGNVYPLTPVRSGGSLESDTPRPVGEYAMSCVGRERLWEYFAGRGETNVATVRLSYACALRYGVLTDIARRVWEGEAVDVTMGAVNVIWQGDANRLALLALEHVDTPPLVVNVTGTRTLLVRDLAAALGERLGRAPVIAGREAPDALLSQTGRMRALLGEPEVDVDTLLDWTAGWVRRGGALLDKPTRFEVRDGGF